MTDDDTHTYPEPDDEEGFLYVREWEDHQLIDEYLFLARLFQATASEVGFRADHPEHRDGTGHITAGDIEAYEAADAIAEMMANLSYGDKPDRAE
jgi:hypothetical protein